MVGGTVGVTDVFLDLKNNFLSMPVMEAMTVLRYFIRSVLRPNISSLIQQDLFEESCYMLIMT